MILMIHRLFLRLLLLLGILLKLLVAHILVLLRIVKIILLERIKLFLQSYWFLISKKFDTALHNLKLFQKLKL
jgi:hypothetical protein